MKLNIFKGQKIVIQRTDGRTQTAVIFKIAWDQEFAQVHFSDHKSYRGKCIPLDIIAAMNPNLVLPPTPEHDKTIKSNSSSIYTEEDELSDEEELSSDEEIETKICETVSNDSEEIEPVKQELSAEMQEKKKQLEEQESMKQEWLQLNDDIENIKSVITDISDSSKDIVIMVKEILNTIKEMESQQLIISSIQKRKQSLQLTSSNQLKNNNIIVKKTPKLNQQNLIISLNLQNNNSFNLEYYTSIPRTIIFNRITSSTPIDFTKMKPVSNALVPRRRIQAINIRFNENYNFYFDLFKNKHHYLKIIMDKNRDTENKNDASKKILMSETVSTTADLKSMHILDVAFRFQKILHLQ